MHAKVVRADVVTPKLIKTHKYGSYYAQERRAHVVFAGSKEQCEKIVSAALQAEDAWKRARNEARIEFDRATMPFRDKRDDAMREADEQLDTCLAAIVPAALSAEETA